MITRRQSCTAIAAAGLLIMQRGISPVSAKKRSGKFVARYWHNFNNKEVQCELCPHGCLLSEGKTGRCRNRQNRDGVLYALGYGKPCAVHVDPIEKKPFYHVLPGRNTFSIGVAGCNLRCKNCQNYTISQKSPLEINSMNLSPDLVVKQAVVKKCPIVAFTYTEPSVWIEYVIDTSDKAHTAGLKTALISSGYSNPAPFEDCLKVLDFARFDLKSFSDKTYRDLNAGTLQPVLDTIVRAKKSGTWVEIINLIIPGWNDSEKEIRALCRWVKTYTGNDTPIHFSRFFPIYRLSHGIPTPLKTLQKACAIAQAEGLLYSYIGNVPGEGTATICPECGKTVIDRKGYLIIENRCNNGICEFCGKTIAGVWKE